VLSLFHSPSGSFSYLLDELLNLLVRHNYNVPPSHAGELLLPDRRTFRVLAGLYRAYVVHSAVKHSDVIERINLLLDSPATGTTNTSMRMPTTLRDAAALAVKELGVAPSATALTAGALRAALEAMVMQAALDDHYALHPETRPTLGDLAIAAAELDGNPLADEPDLLQSAAEQVAARRPNAGPDDVLLWAEARRLPAA
jgi:hypothetical protein